MLKRVERFFRGDKSESKSKTPARRVAAHTTSARTANVAQPQTAYGDILIYDVKLPRTPEELNGYVMSIPHLNALIKSLNCRDSTAKVYQACDDIKRLQRSEAREPGSDLSIIEVNRLRREVTNLLSEVHDLENNYTPPVRGEAPAHALSVDQIRSALAEIAELDRQIEEELNNRYRDTFPTTPEEFAYYVHNEQAFALLVNKCKSPFSVENLLLAKGFALELQNLNLEPRDAYRLRCEICLKLKFVVGLEKQKHL